MNRTAVPGSNHTSLLRFPGMRSLFANYCNWIDSAYVRTRGTPQVQYADIRKMVLCQGLPLCLRICRPIHGTPCPKSQLKSTCLTPKFGSFLGTPQVHFADIRKMVLCQGLPLCLRICRPIHGTSCPKSQLKSTCLTPKFGSFLDRGEMGKKG